MAPSSTLTRAPSFLYLRPPRFGSIGPGGHGATGGPHAGRDRDLRSRARFNQLQWVSLDTLGGPFKHKAKNVGLYVVAICVAVAAAVVVCGVRVSVSSIAAMVTTTFIAPDVADRSVDPMRARSEGPPRAARHTVAPTRGVLVEPGVSPILEGVPDFDRRFKGDIASVGTVGRYGSNPPPLRSSEMGDESFLVYTETLPGYTALACNW